MRRQLIHAKLPLLRVGVVALETMVERLAHDHERANRIAVLLADRFPGSVDPVDVETNIVCARRAALPPSMVDDLAELGVLCGTIDPHTIRFVAHKDVDDDDLRRVATALDVLAAR